MKSGRELFLPVMFLGKTEIYLDETSGLTVPEMKAKLRRLRGVDLVIIDYLQL